MYGRVAYPFSLYLYVVIDDWREGFSRHKIDFDDDDELWRLPSPAAIRMEFSNVCAGAQFMALGRRIVGCTDDRGGLIVVYDTGTVASAIVCLSPCMAGTHSYDTESHEVDIPRHWMLPFTAEAVYDAELDAWVGHHQVSKYFPGSIVCCDIPTPGAEEGTPVAQLSWKQCEVLLCSSPWAAHWYRIGL
ncbi:hypothetical protein SETIT_6G094000v2 [Setaria italica]|uniref:Uncharacterized protein n=1 Tax=Setaria italica TaxID=4555 RepID=A0A368RJW3_SETIT|nr:hypothetical protein SETIT_6G094000v2 [Setaria italica]